MGGDGVDFDSIFETLREMDFANKQLKSDAPKVGGGNIIRVSYFGVPEKMDKQAPEALERLKKRASERVIQETVLPTSFFSAKRPIGSPGWAFRP